MSKYAVWNSSSSSWQPCFTQAVGAGVDDGPLAVDPGDHGEEVRDEAGHVALEEDVVAADDVGLVHVRLVLLCHH